MLSEIVDTVDDELTIIFCSGVRSDRHIFIYRDNISRRIQIGTNTVCVGRIWIWGLSVFDREFGLRHVVGVSA